MQCTASIEEVEGDRDQGERQEGGNTRAQARTLAAGAGSPRSTLEFARLTSLFKRARIEIFESDYKK